MIKVISVGDIMPGGILHGTKCEYLSEEVKELLGEGSIRVGNFECGVGNEPHFVEEKMARDADIVYVEDDDMRRLVEMNIDLVSLANNHFFDLSAEGAAHAIEMLDTMGILHCGAGRNIEEAQRPAVCTVDGKRIAFVAFCDPTMGWIPVADKEKAGVNPLDERYSVEEIKQYKSQYDYVVAMVHWGKEHTYDVTGRVYQFAQILKKAGADLILGGHSHRVQPMVNYRNQSIVYSMGNFLFPDRLIAPPLRVTYYPKEEIDITKLPTTNRWPEVTEVTLKKWKPLANNGMIVTSTFDGNKVKSSYVFTSINEKGFVSVNKSIGNVRRLLDRKSFVLKYIPYIQYLRIRELIVRLQKKFHLLLPHQSSELD